jgi:predicted RNA-binding Zn-ribbon protein involved in translation (DUF1610 family)
MKTSTTSNREVLGDYVEFSCPSCGKEKIVRSLHDRTTAKTYTCKSCGFMGP